MSEKSKFSIDLSETKVSFDGFRFHKIAFYEGKLAIATSSNLLISEQLYVNPDARPNNFQIQAIVGFNVELSGPVSTLKWATENLICVGFESGNILCLDQNGNCISEVKLFDSAVQSIQISDFDLEQNNGIFWALFEKGTLVSMPLSNVISPQLPKVKGVRIKLIGALATSDLILSSPRRTRPHLHQSSQMFLQTLLSEEEKTSTTSSSSSSSSSSLMNSSQSIPSHCTHTLFIGGEGPALSLYNVGGQLHFQHVGKLAGYVKERVVGAISKTFFSFFGSSNSSSSSSSSSSGGGGGGIGGGGGMGGERGGSEFFSDSFEESPLPSLLDFEDPKRRILRLSLDPRGTLLAAADNVGRVTLYDIRTGTVIRLWKGFRDARLAWSETTAQEMSQASLPLVYDPTSAAPSTSSSPSSSSSYHSSLSRRPSIPPLALVIYGPQIGLAYLYAMRHGPCLRCLPLGASCQIFSAPEIQWDGSSKTRCYLARIVSNDLPPSSSSSSTTTNTPSTNSTPCTILSISILSPFESSSSDLNLQAIQEKEKEKEQIENEMKKKKEMKILKKKQRKEKKLKKIIFEQQKERNKGKIKSKNEGMGEGKEEIKRKEDGDDVDVNNNNNNDNNDDEDSLGGNPRDDNGRDDDRMNVGDRFYSSDQDSFGEVDHSEDDDDDDDNDDVDSDSVDSIEEEEDDEEEDEDDEELGGNEKKNTKSRNRTRSNNFGSLSPDNSSPLSSSSLSSTPSFSLPSDPDQAIVYLLLSYRDQRRHLKSPSLPLPLPLPLSLPLPSSPSISSPSLSSPPSSPSTTNLPPLPYLSLAHIEEKLISLLPLTRSLSSLARSLDLITEIDLEDPSLPLPPHPLHSSPQTTTTTSTPTTSIHHHHQKQQMNNLNPNRSPSPSPSLHYPLPHSPLPHHPHHHHFKHSFHLSSSSPSSTITPSSPSLSPLRSQSHSPLSSSSSSSHLPLPSSLYPCPTCGGVWISLSLHRLLLQTFLSRLSLSSSSFSSSSSSSCSSSSSSLPSLSSSLSSLPSLSQWFPTDFSLPPSSLPPLKATLSLRLQLLDSFISLRDLHRSLLPSLLSSSQERQPAAASYPYPRPQNQSQGGVGVGVGGLGGGERSRGMGVGAGMEDLSSASKLHSPRAEALLWLQRTGRLFRPHPYHPLTHPHPSYLPTQPHPSSSPSTSSLPSSSPSPASSASSSLSPLSYSISSIPMKGGLSIPLPFSSLSSSPSPSTSTTSSSYSSSSSSILSSSSSLSPTSSSSSSSSSNHPSSHSLSSSPYSLPSLLCYPCTTAPHPYSLTPSLSPTPSSSSSSTSSSSSSDIFFLSPFSRHPSSLSSLLSSSSSTPSTPSTNEKKNCTEFHTPLPLSFSMFLSFFSLILPLPLSTSPSYSSSPSPSSSLSDSLSSLSLSTSSHPPPPSSSSSSTTPLTTPSSFSSLSKSISPQQKQQQEREGDGDRRQEGRGEEDDDEIIGRISLKSDLLIHLLSSHFHLFHSSISSPSSSSSSSSSSIISSSSSSSSLSIDLSHCFGRYDLDSLSLFGTHASLSSLSSLSSSSSSLLSLSSSSSYHNLSQIKQKKQLIKEWKRLKKEKRLEREWREREERIRGPSIHSLLSFFSHTSPSSSSSSHSSHSSFSSSSIFSSYQFWSEFNPNLSSLSSPSPSPTPSSTSSSSHLIYSLPSLLSLSHLLSFLVAPLVGDVFGIPPYLKICRSLGLVGLSALPSILPLFSLFLEIYPTEGFALSLLQKPLSSSPFQRWLRDLLLAAQDDLSLWRSRGGGGEVGKGEEESENEEEEVDEVEGNNNNNNNDDDDDAKGRDQEREEMNVTHNSISSSPSSFPLPSIDDENNQKKIDDDDEAEKDDDDDDEDDEEEDEEEGELSRLKPFLSLLSSLRLSPPPALPPPSPSLPSPHHSPFFSTSTSSSSSSSSSTSSSFFSSPLDPSPSSSSSSSSSSSTSSSRPVIQPFLSFDLLTRVCLRPTWDQIRHMRAGGAGPISLALNCPSSQSPSSSSHLLQAGGLAPQVVLCVCLLEALGDVSDQVERRSYGAAQLRACFSLWDSLRKQLRLALLVAGRVEEVGAEFGRVIVHSVWPVSVAGLGSSSLSLYRVLALDSLCFASQPADLSAIEARCLESSGVRPSPSPSSSSISASSSSSSHSRSPLPTPTSTPSSSFSIPSPSQIHESELPVRAWGASADKKWRELIELAEGGSGASSSTTDKTKRAKKKRPLLVLFPSHNCGPFLSCYRTLIFMERWFVQPKSVDRLTIASSHLYSLPPHLKYPLASECCRLFLFPMIKRFLELEEDPSLLSSATKPHQEFMNAMSDISLVSEFCKASVSILACSSEPPSQIERGWVHILGSGTLDGNPAYLPSFSAPLTLSHNHLSLSNDSSTTFTQTSFQHNLPIPLPFSLPSTDSSSSSTAISSPTPTSGAVGWVAGVARGDLLDPAPMDLFEEERAIDTARPDPVIPGTLRLLESWPPRSDRPLARLLWKYYRSRALRIPSHPRSVLTSLLWVLQLRVTCGLRGVRASEFFEKAYLDRLFKALLSSPETSLATPDLVQAGPVIGTCFHVPPPTSTSSSSTSSTDRPTKSPAIVRLESLRFEFVSQCLRRLVPRSPSVVYVLADLWSLPQQRVRLQHLSALIERADCDEAAEDLMAQIPDLGPLVECVLLGLRVRMGFTLAHIERLPAYGPLLASMDAEAVAWIRGSVGSPDPKTLDLISKGKTSPVPYSLASTRHLVLLLQGQLISVSGAVRDSTWLDRKTKCDVLLQMCQALQQIPNR